MNHNNTVGIKDIGIYVPEGLHTSQYIAKQSGIPQEVIEEKFGILEKHKAGSEEHPSDMAIKAANKVLKNISPADLDLVIYHGSEYKDFYLYNLAAKIQHEIGASNANAFEVHSLCSAGVLSLQIAKNMMLANDYLNNVLLVTASRELDLVDYTNLDSRFMFNFGDGAAAVLLKKNCNQNIVLQTHMITDGSFADDVASFGIGSRNLHKNKELHREECNLDVADIDSMRERLNAVTEENFYEVIEKSVEKSGFSEADIDYIAPIHMKYSFLKSILERFDLTEEDSYFLNKYGHCQSADAFISVHNGHKLGRIKKGDLVVMLGAGTGYTWAATCVEWG